MAGGSIGDIWWMLRGDGARLKADAKKEGAAAGDVAATGFKNKWKAGLSNMKGGLLGGIGLGAGLGAVQAVTAATSALTDQVFKSIDAASDQREAFALGAQVFEENSQEIEEWASTMADSAGLATTEAINFASNFGNAFKNVGFTIDETAEKSKAMTELAADLGSAFNATGEEAATALRSGLLGESEPLRRFGVFLSEAAVQAKAAELGIADLGEKLTDNQKVAARYAIIMEQTADSQGMFGRDSESLADTQKQLEAQLENVSAEIGETLLPYMVKFAEFLKEEVVPRISDFADALDDTREAAEDADNPFVTIADLWADLTKMRLDEPRTEVGKFNDSLTNLVDDMIDMGTPWDTFTKATEDLARAQSEAAETSREAGRGLGVLEASVPPTEEAVEDLGQTVQRVSGRVVTNTNKMGESFKDYRDRVLGYALDVVDKAYQIIEDKAALTAANVEKAELAKVIATGKATDEQKARYKELTEEQVRLVISLAENGAEQQQVVTDAIEALKKDLETATGNERKAIQATINALERLRKKAAVVQAQLKALKDASKLGIGSSALIGGNWNNNAWGGPVPAAVPTWVGEHGRELFVPDAPGQIIPNHIATVAGTTEPAISSSGGNTYNVTLLDKMPVYGPRDLGAGLRMLEDQGHIGSRRRR